MRNIIIFLSLMTMLLQVSCRKDRDRDSSVYYPTFEKPYWSVSNSELYEYSMSAIVILPNSLLSYENEADELAVFCGSECRGTAKRIQVDAVTSVWAILIYGSGNESLYFKYYSSHNKYMYKDATYLMFEDNDKYGTFDEPVILSMEIVAATEN
ncbi:MAG: hypothetical protein IIV19_00975 [Bacteroidaceae bacterium]|nr:hypothetical protein [Bacteroidaceae bacterium]